MTRAPLHVPTVKPVPCGAQVLFAQRGRWQVPEVNKAYVFLADLIASMIFVMLLRDLEVCLPRLCCHPPPTVLPDYPPGVHTIK